jgi:hypothetical protein
MPQKEKPEMTATLKPWFAVATPHEDIRQGKLSEAIFAANLWAVVQGDAPEVYLDPAAFFAKTYLTSGLTSVLKKVSRALTGEADAGDRILSLQTSFGGGKTHTLVALWHLARHADKLRAASDCADLREALGDLPARVKNVAVFTNQTCDATQGRRTPEGIQTRTLWGELALQLGGVELYRKIEANDQARTVPQGLFAEILRQAAPCVILLDELADYCVGASAVEVGNVTLADLTISFVQQLTDAITNVKGAVVVATLPASHYEVASSERGQELLKSLEARFGRMAADTKPVADDEIYEVVRRRLFESVGDRAEHEKIADAYLKMYQQHKNEVPTEATRAAYKENLIAAYPFHPTLIDAFYLRWGSHGDFQRTRGVLRLLAGIVGDLWQRRNTETQSQPLIQPCHMRWTIDALRAALTRLWGAAYDSVAAADVIGDKANAILFDEERGGEYLSERIAQGIAATILLGSFGGQGERAGFSTKEIRLCVGRPNVNWGYTDGALLALEDRGYYLHPASAGSLGKRYWFGAKPTLTKLIVQYRAQFAAQDFDSKIIETLRQQIKNLRPEPATWKVLVDPEADLPEQKALTILIMPPSCVWSDGSSAIAVEGRLLKISQKCGAKDRHYRNTLLFLLPSARGLARLRSALREVAALESVQQDYASQLDDDQRQDLEGKLKDARKAVGETLGIAYTHVARVEGQSLAVAALSDAKTFFSEHLLAVWRQIVEDEEWVLRKVGVVTLQRSGLIPPGAGVRVKDAIETFLRYTDKSMIASREAVLEGLQQAVRDRHVGIGRGLDLASLQRRWCGESVALDPNEEGLWIIPPFEPETKQPTYVEQTATVTTATTPPPPSGAQPIPHSATEGRDSQESAKQVRRLKIVGSVPLESWGEVFRCFIAPSTRSNFKQLRLGIDFEMETSGDQALDENDALLKAMRESARQLGLQMEEE